MPPDLIRSIDDWARRNADGSRSEAIRRLVEIGLASAPRTEQRRQSALKASEMAGEQIDRLGDTSATPEERAGRKRRLLKGPKEFREARARRRGG
jgi:hypothetical protein